MHCFCYFVSQTWGDSHTLVGALLGLATLTLAEGETHKAASLLTEAQVWRERWEGKDSGREGEERKKRKGKREGGGERRDREGRSRGLHLGAYGSVLMLCLFFSSLFLLSLSLLSLLSLPPLSVLCTPSTIPLTGTPGWKVCFFSLRSCVVKREKGVAMGQPGPWWSGPSACWRL